MTIRFEKKSYDFVFFRRSMYHLVMLYPCGYRYQRKRCGKLWFPNSNRNSHENDNRICTCKIFLLKNCFKMYKVNIINIYVKPKVACSDRFLRYFRIQNVIIFVVSVVALRAKDFLLAQMPTPYQRCLSLPLLFSHLSLEQDNTPTHINITNY